MWWVLLFVAIAVGGALVLGRLLLGLWRKAGRLLQEADVLAVRAGELADLLAQIEVPASAVASTPRAGRVPDPGETAWPGTVETYDDRGASAPGKKESCPRSLSADSVLPS